MCMCVPTCVHVCACMYMCKAISLSWNILHKMVTRKSSRGETWQIGLFRNEGKGWPAGLYPSGLASCPWHLGNNSLHRRSPETATEGSNADSKATMAESSLMFSSGAAYMKHAARCQYVKQIHTSTHAYTINYADKRYI